MATEPIVLDHADRCLHVHLPYQDSAEQETYDFYHEDLASQPHLAYSCPAHLSPEEIAGMACPPELPANAWLVQNWVTHVAPVIAEIVRQDQQQVVRRSFLFVHTDGIGDAFYQMHQTHGVGFNILQAIVPQDGKWMVELTGSKRAIYRALVWLKEEYGIHLEYHDVVTGLISV